MIIISTWVTTIRKVCETILSIGKSAHSTNLCEYSVSFEDYRTKQQLPLIYMNFWDTLYIGKAQNMETVVTASETRVSS